MSQGVDGIVVIPVDTSATDPVTEAATGADIPLVYVNRRPENLPDGVAYAGSDSYVSGELEMTELAKMLDGKGNVAILIGTPSTEAAIDRTKGCKDVVDKNPDMKVVREQSADYMREKGMNVMQDWIQSGVEIDAVCANNDDMALGAIQALKDANKLDDVLVGGVDATTEALSAMKAGELAVTVFQDAKGQARAGLESIIKIKNGESIPDGYVDVPYQLVNKDNLDEYDKLING